MGRKIYKPLSQRLTEGQVFFDQKPFNNFKRYQDMGDSVTMRRFDEDGSLSFYIIPIIGQDLSWKFDCYFQGMGVTDSKLYKHFFQEFKKWSLRDDVYVVENRGSKTLDNIHYMIQSFDDL